MEPLGVIELMAVRKEAAEAGVERRGQRGRSSRSRGRNVYARATGLPQLSWTLPMRDAQGEAAEVRFGPSRTEPAEITGPVPIEWAQEAARLMLAMEKAFHRIAGGTPLQLHYPPGRAKAAPRWKTVRLVPQKGKGKAPAMTQRQPIAARPEARGVVITSPSEAPQFQRELRKRPAQKKLLEGPAQKKRKKEAEREYEEGDEQFSLSNGSDSASDPRFRFTPGDLAAAEVSDEDSDSDGIDPEDFDD
ncbi:hypothetical protein RHMOL_Rhmol03G0287100 [Rhododendron molle]|uniref:Uncharacterized protein n=1 Tax=Rhododendron molle TaxID=49168 RepID=A0ACC0PM19_RHOML|nr:hypothetical protein RHMOL_Rhmol03G0287100 [Rhododendron molle]